MTLIFLYSSENSSNCGKFGLLAASHWSEEQLQATRVPELQVSPLHISTLWEHTFTNVPGSFGPLTIRKILRAGAPGAPEGAGGLKDQFYFQGRHGYQR